MIFLSSIGEALAAIDQFLIEHARDLDSQSASILIAASAKVSPVDKIVGVAELLYSCRETLPSAGLTAAGQVIEYATRNGWHGLADGRGKGMLDAIRRQLGEPHPTGGKWPKKSDDPPATVNASSAPIAAAQYAQPIEAPQ